MALKLSSTDVVEKEFQALQQKIGESVDVLENLKDIKGQFSDIVTTYNQAKRLLADAETKFGDLEQSVQMLMKDAEQRLASQEEKFGQLEATVESQLDKFREQVVKVHSSQEEKFEQLGASTESQLGGFREQIIKIHDGLQAANKNIRSDMGLQAAELKGEVEGRLAESNQRFVSFQEEVEASFEGVDNLIKLFDETSNSVFKTVSKNTDRVSRDVESLDKQLRQARGFTFVAFVLVLVVGGYVGYGVFQTYF